MTKTIQEVTTADRQFRATVEARGDGLFQVDVWSWSQEISEEGQDVCSPFWELIGTTSIVGTEDEAFRIARERLGQITARAIVGE